MKKIIIAILMAMPSDVYADVGFKYFGSSTVVSGDIHAGNVYTSNIALDTTTIAETLSLEITARQDADLAVGVTTAAIRSDLTTETSNREAADLLKINLSSAGIAYGIATLDGASKIPVAQLPNSVMEYMGSWDAAANSPHLTDGTGDNGDTYRTAVEGSTDTGHGEIHFYVGDFIIYNGSIWERAPAADGVTDVNSLTGSVTLYTDNITEDGAPSNLWFTNARATDALSASLTAIAVDTTTLTENLASEITNRQTADLAIGVTTASLRTDLNTEISDRQIADAAIAVDTGTLTVNLASEITNRQNADLAIGVTTAALRTDLNDVIVSTGGIAANLASEITNRQNADLVIGLATAAVADQRVPYTGATGHIDTGVYSLRASSLTLTGNGGQYGLHVTSGVALGGLLYTNSGRVGIGTSNPLEQLNLYKTDGSATLRFTDANINPTQYGIGKIEFLSTEGDGGAGVRAQIVGSSSELAYKSGVIQFWTKYMTDPLTQRMIIDATGKVGIGTTTPSYDLDLNGSQLIQGQTIVTGTVTIQGDGLDVKNGLFRVATTTGIQMSTSSYMADGYYYMGGPIQYMRINAAESRNNYEWIGTTVTGSNGRSTFYPTTTDTQAGAQIFSSSTTAKVLCIATRDTTTEIDYPFVSLKSWAADMKSFTVNCGHGINVVLGGPSIQECDTDVQITCEVKGK